MGPRRKESWAIEYDTSSSYIDFEHRIDISLQEIDYLPRLLRFHNFSPTTEAVHNLAVIA